MRYLRWILAAIAIIVLAVLTTGALLPRKHVATVQAHYSRTPGEIYDAIADVAAGPRWRSDLDSVRILSAPGEPLRWQEHGSWGSITFVRDSATPPSLLVGRIADVDQGFGGTWTYRITPDATGSVLTVTENGEVSNPFFRFMSRFIFGHYRTLETYARDLGRRFDDTVAVRRVAAGASAQ